MNANIPIMLKVPLSEDNDPYYIALSSVTIMKDEQDKHIIYLLDNENDVVEVLESVDGSKVQINELKCKTYEEFLVALDLNNLVHGTSIFGSDTSIDALAAGKICDLTNKIKRLKEENTMLKSKFAVLKNLVNKKN